MRDRLTRREALATLGSALAVGAAGCVEAPGVPESIGEDELPTPDLASEQAGDHGGLYAEVYREAIDSTVLVRGEGPASAQGSGFVVRDQFIVTNDHVVAGIDNPRIQYSGNRWSSGAIIGQDIFSDLAVVEAEERPSYATPLSLSERDPVIGQEVMALGNPLGLDASVSQGIISGVNRSLPSPTDFSIPNAIQTDASVNRGNSGGPLVDLDAEVAGVVFAGGGEGIGFAISAALANRVVPALIEDGEFEHTFLGVRLTGVTPEIAEANNLDRPSGVLITEVQDDGPSHGVLQGSTEETVDGVPVWVGGDVILEIEDIPIPTQEELSRVLALETDPGDTITLTIARDGDTTEVEVTLGRRREPDRDDEFGSLDTVYR